MGMLSLVTPAFLAIPNPENKRILHEGKVIQLDGERAVIEFQEQLSPEVDGEVTLFAEVRGKFFQQGATIVSIVATEPKLTVELTTVGDPVSAEQRGSYRTSVVAWNVPVRVDKMVGCVLADVSPEGVGVITPKPLTVGTTAQVSFSFEGTTIEGALKVQTAKIMPSGTLRFGLFVPDRRSPMRLLLQKLAGQMQRAQLKRLSGAA